MSITLQSGPPQRLTHVQTHSVAAAEAFTLVMTLVAHIAVSKRRASFRTARRRACSLVSAGGAIRRSVRSRCGSSQKQALRSDVHA